MELANRNASPSPRNRKHHHKRVHGLVAATISVPLHKAWKIVSDFYDLASWVPTIRKCYEIKPGVRYAESVPSSNGKFRWVEEELTAFSAARYSMSYKIIAGNFGLQDYSATVKLAKSCDGSKTIVRWSFGMSIMSEKTKEQQELYLRQGIRSLERAATKIS